jgi:hypothetical protein
LALFSQRREGPPELPALGEPSGARLPLELPQLRGDWLAAQPAALPTYPSVENLALAPHAPSPSSPTVRFRSSPGGDTADADAAWDAASLEAEWKMVLQSASADELTAMMNWAAAVQRQAALMPYDGAAEAEAAAAASPARHGGAPAGGPSAARPPFGIFPHIPLAGRLGQRARSPPPRVLRAAGCAGPQSPERALGGRPLWM